MNGLQPIPARVGTNAVTAVTATLFAAFAMFCAWHAYSPFVPERSMRLWATGTIAFLAFWIFADVRLILWPPPPGRRDRVWSIYGVAVALGLCGWVQSVLWLLLPYGDGPIQLTTVIFGLGYVAIYFLTQPGWLLTNRINIIVTVASLAIILVIEAIPYWQYLSPFVVVFGGMMLLLNNMLAEAIEANRLARLSAEAELATRTRFLASASHDLGQPLQSARLFFDQAMRGQDPGQRAEAATGAKNAMGAMARQLAQMLDHLRLESGAVEPKPVALDAGAVIGRVVAQFDPVSALAGVDLRAVPSRLVVHVDADLIERALGNLVDNALRHADARRVLVGARRHGDRVRIWVVDDGRGVAADDLPGLFVDYVQGSDRAGRERGGFGLGLASVRRLLALMGGSAGLDPRWAKGSAFYLDLPAAAASTVSETGQ